MQLLVYREKIRGESSQPYVALVLMVGESETCLSSLTCYLLVRTGTFSQESFSGSMVG